MSQIILVNSHHGIAVLGDTYVFHDAPGIDYPHQFPKVFRVGEYILGTFGVTQISQMLLNGYVEIKKGVLQEKDLQQFIIDEYRDLCSGVTEPTMLKLIRQSVQAGYWNPGLLVVHPNNDVFLFRDQSNCHTGQLLGGKTTNNIIVLGPTFQRANTVENNLRIVGSATSLSAIKSFMEREITESASIFPTSVGTPIIGFTKMGAVINSYVQPSAAAIDATYEGVTATLDVWADTSRIP